MKRRPFEFWYTLIALPLGAAVSLGFSTYVDHAAPFAMWLLGIGCGSCLTLLARLRAARKRRLGEIRMSQWKYEPPRALGPDGRQAGAGSWSPPTITTVRTEQ